VDVPGASDHIEVEVLVTKRSDRTEMGHDRPVPVTLQDQGQARRHIAIGRHRCRVHAVRPHLLDAEIPVVVVADQAAEGDAQPEPRCGTGGDRRRAAEPQIGAAGEHFPLTELDTQVRRRDDEIGIDVPDDDEVDVAHPTTYSGR
jgi:hypothetical protein